MCFDYLVSTFLYLQHPPIHPTSYVNSQPKWTLQRVRNQKDIDSLPGFTICQLCNLGQVPECQFPYLSKWYRNSFAAPYLKAQGPDKFHNSLFSFYFKTTTAEPSNQSHQYLCKETYAYLQREPQRFCHHINFVGKLIKKKTGFQSFLELGVIDHGLKNCT